MGHQITCDSKSKTSQVQKISGFGVSPVKQLENSKPEMQYIK